MPTTMAHDVSYAFDSEVELLGFTSEVHFYFSFFHEGDVNAWYDKLGEHTKRNGINDFCGHFTSEANRIYTDWFAKDDTLRRGVCVINGMLTFRYLLHDLVLAVINEAIDEVVDTYTVEQAYDRICTPIYAKHVLKNNEQAIRFQKLWGELHERAYIVRETLMDSLDYREHMVDEENRKREGVKEKLRQDIAAGRDPIYHDLRKRLPPPTKPEKKAVIKSVNFLESLMGKKNTHLFVSGNGVKVTGEKFDFVVSKGSLFKASHGGVNVMVTNKEGKELVKLCWYVRDTLAAEQLATLAMLVASGDEDEIVRVGNIMASFNQTDPAFKVIDEIRLQGKKDLEKEFPEAMREATIWTQMHNRIKPWYEENLCNYFSNPLLKMFVSKDANEALKEYREGQDILETMDRRMELLDAHA